MATPLIDGETLNLGFKFKLHANKVSEASTQAKIRDAIEKVTGTVYQINAIVDKNLETNLPTPNVEPVAKPTPDNPHLDSVKNIFGGGEVLES